MIDLLSQGASSLRAYQAAMNTTSENIANANTDGYTRRTTQLNELAATNDGLTTGLGVTVSGLSRASDELRNTEVRSTGSDLARTQASVTWLQRIDSALSDTKVADRLTAFFGSAQSLAADPSSTPARSAMLSAAQQAADAFTAAGSALDAAARELDANVDASVAGLNNLSQALASVNLSLGRTQANSAAKAQLLDQRDSLLEQMSAITDMSAQFDDLGRATIRAGGVNGAVLVQPGASVTISAAHNDAGVYAFKVSQGGVSRSLVPQGGTLAGYSESARRIADAKSTLDKTANDFATGVNAVQARGADLSGNPGAPIFAMDAEGGTANMTVVLADPAGIAAAASGGGPRDNGNLSALAALRKTGGFETAVTDMVVANGSALSGRQMVADAQGAIHDGAITNRSQIRDVDLDQEAVDLLRFQQAYQASSHVIQTARDTFQTLLNIG